MAFSDPQTVTINAVAQTLARTGFGVDTGAFTEDVGEYKLLISHNYGKRARRTIRLESKKTDADVMDSSLMVPYTMAAHLTVDTPLVGYDLTEQSDIVEGFLAYLSASSYANVTKLLGGEC